MKTINLLQLYPRDMNIYGDMGNLLVLQKRLERYGYTVNNLAYNPGDDFPKDVDLIVGGGGQDSGQSKIQTDLVVIGPKLIELANSDVPMLVICGMYQLFGNFFITSDGQTIEGIGLFDTETRAGSERLIGNIITKSSKFGEIVGYENHSGQTTLGKHVEPLGRVLLGAGNNSSDDTEGAIFRNVIGTYLHGALLPKNPAIADWLITQAIARKFGKFEPKNEIDDSLADLARQSAMKRPR